MKLPLLTLAVFSIVGLFASFFHLGTPAHAFYTILGFGRSWMSNEIVFTGAFIGLAVITAALVLVQKKTNPLFMIVTGIVGLMAVFCMASIYAATRVNGWDNVNTYLVFFGTVFTLGPVLAASLMSTTLKVNFLRALSNGHLRLPIWHWYSSNWYSYSTVSTPAMQLISGTTAAASLSVYSQMIAFRWVLEVAGFALLGFMAMASLKKVNDYLVYAAFAILLIAEVMSRYLFYVMGA